MNMKSETRNPNLLREASCQGYGVNPLTNYASRSDGILDFVLRIYY